MLAVDWHSEEHVSWLCEQAGIEFKGLPLAPYDRLRLMSIIEKNPPGKVPSFPKKNIKEATMTDTKIVPVRIDSQTAEKTLFDQYTAEIAKAQANQTRYASLVRQAKEDEKSLTKKRASLAKILGIKVEG